MCNKLNAFLDYSKKSLILFCLVTGTLVLGDLVGMNITDAINKMKFGPYYNMQNEMIYNNIQNILKNKYQGQDDKIQCMMDEFRRINITDKLSSLTPFDLIVNQDKLRWMIQPFVDDANFKCKFIMSFQSPLVLFLIIIIFATVNILGIILCAFAWLQINKKFQLISDYN